MWAHCKKSLIKHHLGDVKMEPEIKVTKIAKRWHARLSIDGEVIDEMACELQCDIGWICREMLRWHDKLGGCSKFANAAREQQTVSSKGRIWWQKDLRPNVMVTLTKR